MDVDATGDLGSRNCGEGVAGAGLVEENIVFSGVLMDMGVSWAVCTWQPLGLAGGTGFAAITVAGFGAPAELWAD